MKTIKISGRSDDLIEIEGDIRDEGSGPGFVELSTGDVFEVTYDDRVTGCWNVRYVCGRDAAESIEIVRKVVADDDGYGGHASVTGDITWVDFWDAWPPDEEQVRDRLADNIEGLTGRALMDAYSAACGRGST